MESTQHGVYPPRLQYNMILPMYVPPGEVITLNINHKPAWDIDVVVEPSHQPAGARYLCLIPCGTPPGSIHNCLHQSKARLGLQCCRRAIAPTSWGPLSRPGPNERKVSSWETLFSAVPHLEVITTDDNLYRTPSLKCLK